MQSAAVVNYAPEPNSVEIREIDRPEIGSQDVLLEVSHVVIPSNAQALQRSGYGDLPPYLLWAIEEAMRQRGILKESRPDNPVEEPQAITPPASLRQLIIEGLTQNPLRR